MTNKIYDSAELVRQVRDGTRDAFAWGDGYTYDICQPLHNLPFKGILHTSPQLVGKVVNGISVLKPEDVIGRDPSPILIVGYSIQFRQTIKTFMADHSSVPILFYDDPALIQAGWSGQLVSNLIAASQEGLVSAADRRLLDYAFSMATPARDWPACVSKRVDFWDEFKQDVARALTRQVHFIHQEAFEGHIAEFGTYSGTTASFLAAALADASLVKNSFGVPHFDARLRELHLFDSFRGLPPITNALDAYQGSRWTEGMFKDKTADQLRAQVEQFLPSDRIHIYEGWFKDTLSTIPSALKFSLIHIDCDLYESTYEVLDYLFAHGHVGEGCTIFFDDWNCGHANPDIGERRAWIDVAEKHKLRWSDGGDYSAYGHKLVVHTSDTFRNAEL